MAKTKLSPEQVQRIVHALGDPNRYEMMQRIFTSETAVNCGNAKGELAISDATGSHHLKELLAADLITMERDGRHRLLTPRREVWKAFLRELKEF